MKAEFDIRHSSFDIHLSLPLLMLGIVANDAHDALAVDHLALITHLLY